MSEIDSLEIKIQSEAEDALSTLDRLAEKLSKVSGALGNMNVAKSFQGVQNVFQNMTSGAEKSVDRMDKYIQTASKNMAAKLGGAFDLDKAGIKNLESTTRTLAQSMSDSLSGKVSKNAYTENIDALGKELLESAGNVKEFDSEMQRFYQTLLATGKIKINPIDMTSEDWKDLDGALRGKLNYQAGTSLDTLMTEWRDQFRGIFDGLEKQFNLDSVNDQVQALNQVVKQCREGITIPVDKGMLSDAVWESVISESEKLRQNIGNAQAVLQATGGTTEKVASGGSAASYYKGLEKLTSIDTGKLDNLSTSIATLSNSIQSLNGLTVNTAPILQAASALEQIGKMKLGSGKKISSAISGIMSATQNASSVQTTSQPISYFDKPQREFDTKPMLVELKMALKQYEEAMQTFSSMPNYAPTDIFVNNIKDDIEQLEQFYPQASSTIDKFKDLYERAQQLSAERAENNKIVPIENDLLKTTGRSQDFYGESGELKKKEQELSELKEQYQELISKQQELFKTGDWSKLNFSGLKTQISNIQKSLQPLQTTFKKINSHISAFIKKIGNLGKSMSGTKSSSDKMNFSLNKAFKMILRYGFGIRSVYYLFNRLRRAIVDGFNNLVVYSEETNRSISMLSGSLTQLKNSVAAAASPILNTFAPAIDWLIQKCISGVNAINQLVSALLGRSTWIKATAVTTDYAASLNKAAGAADNLKSHTLGIDELNVVEPDTSSGSGSGSGDTTSAEDMFETEEVESKWKDLANTIKKITDKLFSSLKKAWESEGKFVMDSWKYALNEVSGLVKSVGSDFLDIWQEEKTVGILENILHIVGDIGLTVGNLARNFRVAWEENETGANILRGVRDIIGVIVSNIRAAADATVEWSDKLNFSPLLTKVQAWVESLVPVFDSLSGILSDFYTEVLLPIGQWTIEKGLPDLLQVFIDFNEKVDWESLRSRLSEFWEHLEPFAETVGEGLILFIGDVSDALANFVNSEAFNNFLDKVQEWMDNVDAEDVASALEKIVIAIAGFEVLSTVGSALTSVVNFLMFFANAGTVVEGLGSVTAALGGLSTALGAFAAVEVGVNAGAKAVDNLSEKMGLNGVQTDEFVDRYTGLSAPLNLVKDLFESTGNALNGYGFNANDSAGSTNALAKAMQMAQSEFVLSDEYLAGLQERFEITDEDMEMLRQTMLDTHPELRELADNFGLVSYSAEDLEDVSRGLELIKDGSVNAADAAEKFQDPMYEMSDAAQAFFNDVSSGIISLDDFGGVTGETVTQLDKFVGAANNVETNVLTLDDSIEGTKSSFQQMQDSINATDFTPLGTGVEEFKTKFSGTFSQIGTDLSTWFTESVQPWFTAEKWQEVGQGIYDGISAKWNEFKEWWGGTAIVTWWNENVSPWFTKAKWTEVTNGLKTGIKQKWDDTVKEWKTNITTWWNTNVAPWFTKAKWTEVTNGLKTGIKQKWDDTVKEWKANITTWWNTNVSPWFTLEKWTGMMQKVPEAFKSIFKNAANSAIAIFNNLIDWINSKMHFSWSAVTVAGIEIVPAGSVQLFTIPKIPQFEAGGYPKTASLFWAGENGIPELMGTVGGQTAVAGGEEITGIRDAVYETSSEEVELLKEQNELLRALLQKELEVNIGDRDIAMANRRGVDRMGWAF